MRVLLSDSTQAYLSPGGKQVHAEKLYKYLREVGVDVEYDRWWDSNQKCDILHLLGSNISQINLAKQKGVKLVMTQIVDYATNISRWEQNKLFLKNKIIKKILPNSFTKHIPWTHFNKFDAIVYINDFDKETARRIYSINNPLVYTIPHAIDNTTNNFVETESCIKSTYLISIGSIIKRKNSVLLARLALETKVPIVFIGSDYNKNDTYFKEFEKLIDDKIVKYYGFVEEKKKIELLQNASGFVLLSNAESGCISVYEAANTGLPLLLPDKPWAKAYPNPKGIKYVNINEHNNSKSKLIEFYFQSRKLNRKSFDIITWKEVAELYKNVYLEVLKK